MRTSEHFNLNLVEGSDVVNPLVQDVPNYEAIDTAMFDNKSASVGVATELKSGTVHALTRLNTDAAMFRFKATSRFGVGETFTVDGIQVTALLPDGTPLEDGAYIIGSTVLCSLVETLLTVYTTRTTAEDTDKFDGHTSDYYATKAALDTVDNTATAAGALATQVSGNLTNKTTLDYANAQSTTYTSGASVVKNISKHCVLLIRHNLAYNHSASYGYIFVSVNGTVVANNSIAKTNANQGSTITLPDLNVGDVVSITATGDLASTNSVTITEVEYKA